MTKKKIRYSELAPAAPPAAAAPAPPAPVAPPAPIAPAAPPAAERPRAPRDIARALTPVRGSLAIPRPTPVRGSVAIPRPTPSRGSIAIVRDLPGVAAPSTPLRAPAPAPAADAPTSLRDRARLRTGTADLLVFGAGGEWFGVELGAVEEAIDLPAIRHVPEMPPAMLGVITVRDTLTPVYTPAGALGVTLADGASALVFRRARGRLGIVVDDVDEVHSLELSQLREPPAAASADGILLGVMRYRQGLLALVDAEALIAACQTVPLMETA